MTDNHELLDRIAALDALLLAAVPGQEDDAASWLAERHAAVLAYAQGAPAPAGLEQIQQRTRRIEEKFLHWRRSAIMELSGIEHHLRFLGQQVPFPASGGPTCIDYSA